MAGPTLSMNLGLAAIPETQDPILFNEAYKIYNAIRAVAVSSDRNTGALQPDQSIWAQLTSQDTILSGHTNRLLVIASTNLAAGDFCSVYNNAGVLNARLAGGVGWAGGDCRGFCTTTVLAGALTELILFGLDTFVAGLTIGAKYFVSNAVAGAITAVPPAANGNKIQPVGYALAANLLFFTPTMLTPTLDTVSLAIPVLTP